MEPQLIDYYNEMPHSVNVIDGMNKELSELQEKYDELKNIHNDYIKIHTEETFPYPKIRIQSFDELKEYGNKIYNSVPHFTKIIYNFLNHQGWILELDQPDNLGKGIMGIKGCGYWDNWQIDPLRWKNTTAQDFYNEENELVQYNIYLKCKLLEELYLLFPEYTIRERNWFHKMIDDSFDTISITIGTMLDYDCKIDKNEIHTIIYRIIIEKLFGWGSIEYEHMREEILNPKSFYRNEEYIQNIIYYQCEKCGKIFQGGDAIDYNEEDNQLSWFHENGNLSFEPCQCSV